MEALSAATLSAGVSSASALNLDKPTRFLVELGAISSFELRAECWLTRATYPEAIFEVQSQLDTLDTALTALKDAVHLPLVLSHVLAFGNYLNGGTPRGQADGFHLDVLPKLRDVKSTDNSTNLLAVLVETCFLDPVYLASPRVCPVPLHSKLAPAVEISFDDIHARLRKAEGDIGK
jgi:formin 2